MLDDILLINLFYIEDSLGGIFLLNPKINVVLTIFYLLKLPIKYYVDMRFRNKYNVS
jgi:hypothetical protein